MGRHSRHAVLGIRCGIALFIISEVMFFFSFFWAFFHRRLAPTVSIGCIWPPLGIEVVDANGVPFLNTIVLLTSGASIT